MESLQQKNRPGQLAATADPTPSSSTFITLPLVLHMLIAAFLKAPAALALGAAARWTHGIYPATITTIGIALGPLLVSPHTLQMDWEEWTLGHTRTLAALFQRMPSLTTLIADWNANHLSHIIGAALYLLPEPLMHLTRLEKAPRCRNLPRWIEYPQKAPTPRRLALAMAAGRLPSLENLDFNLCSPFYLYEPSTVLAIAKAIANGCFPNISSLIFSADGVSHVGIGNTKEYYLAIMQAFKTSFENGTQKMMKEITFTSYGTSDFTPFHNFLALPICQELHLIKTETDGEAVEYHTLASQQVLADYLSPCKRPALRYLSPSSYPGLHTFGRLYGSLLNGNAFNLEELQMRHLEGEGLVQLAEIFRVGSFASLCRLHLSQVFFTSETMRAWLTAVWETSNHGANLEEVHLSFADRVSDPDNSDGMVVFHGRLAVRVFAEYLEKGIFPGLKVLYLSGGSFKAPHNAVQFLVEAFQRGVPCTTSLQKVTLWEVNKASVQTLKELLPHAEVIRWSVRLLLTGQDDD